MREALARLAEEGLVVRLPRRGARVAELSPRSLEEISSVRVVLEQFVCERVLERWTASAETELMRARAPHDDGRGARDDEGRRRARRALPRDALAARRPRAADRGGRGAARAVSSAFLRAANAALAPDELRQHAASHVELVELLASGDDAGGRAAAMRRHIELAAERVARARGHLRVTLVVVTDSDLPSAGVEEALLADAGLEVRRAACRTAEDVAGGRRRAPTR